MKNIFISDLKPGDNLFGELFAVKKYKKGTTKKNKPFIDLILSDRTGEIGAKIWSDDISNCDGAKEGEVVSITGKADNDYQGLQLYVTNMSKVDKYNIDDLRPETSLEVDKMFSELIQEIKLVKNAQLKRLLEAFLQDKKTIEKFKESPGGAFVHHAYPGGLLEHTLEIIDILKGYKEAFPDLNEDLLITGAVFHDIGKCYDYQVTTTIEITPAGKLLGHIFIGSEMVKSYGQKTKIDDHLLMEVIHLVLSHHGKTEFGSPVVPKTSEAMALHFADEASSKLNIALNSLKEGVEEGGFTQYHRILGTELYKSKTDQLFQTNLEELLEAAEE